TPTAFGVGSFSDSNGSATSWSVDVNWGDNTADTTFTVAGQGSLGSRSHTYAQGGTFSATVTVTDNANPPASGSGSFQVTVTGGAAAVVVTSAGNQSAYEGASASLNLGSRSDSTSGANSWTVDVKWGDGTADTIFTATSQGLLGSRSHTYGEEGTYTVTVIVTDNANVSGSAAYQVGVSDPAVLASAVNFSATPGTAFSNQAVATFTDPGGAEPNAADPSGTISNHYAAIINWGDGSGTTTGTITVNGSTFTVSGGHTYAQAGTYSVVLTLTHENAPQTTVTGSASVSGTTASVVVTSAGNQSAVEGA